MKKFSRRLKRIELKARFIFINLLFLLLFISCTKQTVGIGIKKSVFPEKLMYLYTRRFNIPGFFPQRMTCDIRGNIYLLGNNKRLVFINNKGEIKEIALENIFPCEIIDIATDGFCIFLLDRLNQKIWTIKREKVSELGFSLDEKPSLLSVSNKGQIGIVLSNSRKIVIFYKNDRRELFLKEPFLQDDNGGLLFVDNNIFLANKKRNKIEVYQIYNPLKVNCIAIDSPNSLTADTFKNVYVAYKEGLILIKANLKMKKLLSLDLSHTRISSNRDRLYILNLDKRKIDVFKIIYSSFAVSPNQ